jgi:hypothetical protein
VIRQELLKLDDDGILYFAYNHVLNRLALKSGVVQEMADVATELVMDADGVYFTDNTQIWRITPK